MILHEWTKICEQVAMTCNAKASSLFIMDRADRSKLVQFSGFGFNQPVNPPEYALPDSIDARACQGLTPWVATTGNVLNLRNHLEIISHPAHRGRYDYFNYKGNERCENLIVIPIKMHIENSWQIIGVLKVENKIGGDCFTDNDLLLLNTVSDYIVSHFDHNLNYVKPAITPYFLLRNQKDLSAVSAIVPNIEYEFIEYFKQYPEKMYEMPPRRFEELIAAIFKNNGFDVYLSPCTRDGGFDVRAIRHDKLTGQNIYLIECKRYAPDNKVGISVVDRLLGVVNRNNASKGIVATTSTFTKDASAVETANKHILSLTDYNSVERWLREIQS